MVNFTKFIKQRRITNMLFILIFIVFLFIFFIAIFGDYENKELEKDYKYMEEILGNKEENK